MTKYGGSYGHRKLTLFVPEGEAKSEVLGIICRQGGPNIVSLRETPYIDIYFDTLKGRRAFLEDFNPLLKAFGLASRPSLGHGRGAERELTIQTLEDIGGS